MQPLARFGDVKYLKKILSSFWLVVLLLVVMTYELSFKRLNCEECNLGCVLNFDCIGR